VGADNGTHKVTMRIAEDVTQLIGRERDVLVHPVSLYRMRLVSGPVSCWL
jgi:hypothetical protein